jgi:hypothetical protein
VSFPYFDYLTKVKHDSVETDNSLRCTLDRFDAARHPKPHRDL